MPVPLFLVSYEEGANGQVDNVYRRMRIKGESIERQWPDAKMSPNLKRKVADKPADDIEFLEATIYDAGRGDYCYHVIWKEGRCGVIDWHKLFLKIFLQLFFLCFYCVYELPFLISIIINCIV